MKNKFVAVLATMALALTGLLVATSAQAWQRSDYDLTGMCTNPTQGSLLLHAAVADSNGSHGDYVLWQDGVGSKDNPFDKGNLTQNDTPITVPWSGGGDTWIVEYTYPNEGFSETFTTDIGDNPLCYPVQPETLSPVVTGWLDSAWPCDATTTTQTRSVTTFAEPVKGGTDWIVDEVGTTVTETQTRNLTVEEMTKCPVVPGELVQPETPSPVVTGWLDSAWPCDATTTTQTRSVTTFAEPVKGGTDWIVDEVGTTVTETQTRNLTVEEMTKCPVVPGELEETEVLGGGETVVPPPVIVPAGAAVPAAASPRFAG